MLARKQRKMMIIVSSIIITISIIAVIIGILYLKTDMFKPSSKLFIKYISQNIENVKPIFNFEPTEIDNEINQNQFETKTEIKIDYKDDEKEENSINQAKIISEGTIEKQEKFISENIELQYEDKKITGMDFILNEELYGIRLDGIKQFVSNKIEQKEEQEEKINLFENINFSENEKEIIKSTYLTIIEQNTTKENYNKEKNKNITINGKTTNANAYSLILTKERYNNLIIKLLERVAKDEIILGKIDKIQENLGEVKYLKEKNLREEFEKQIEKKIEEIKNTNIGQEKVELTVYEKNGVTIKTELKTPTYEIILDLYNNKEELKITLIRKYDNKNKEKAITIKNKNNLERKIEYCDIDDEIEKNKIEIEEIKIKEQDEIKKTLIATYKVEENILKASIDRTYTKTDSIDKEEKIKNNNIIINELESEKANQVKNIIEKKKNEETEKILEKIKLDDINYMLKKLKILNENEIKFEDKDKEIVTETERNRFNSNLTFYIGKEIDTNTLKQLLETIKEDTKKIKIIFDETKDKKELKGFMIELKRNTQSEKEKEEMIKVLEEYKNEKFTVAMSYDEETKLINKISIVSNKFIKK